MRTFFIFILIICLVPSYSQILYNASPPQNSIQEGYIVLYNSDTLYGTINLGSKYGLHKGIIFKDKQGNEREYSPGDINSFHFDSTHFIGNITVFNERWGQYKPYFLQQLNDGYIKMYRFLNLVFNGIPPYTMKVVKEIPQYYIAKGDLPPTWIQYYKILNVYTHDNPKIDSIIKKREYAAEDLPAILNYYNTWLIETGKLSNELRKDSIHSETIINLHQAFEDSLLLYRQEDTTMHNYLFRLINYALNTPEYKGYFIYDQIDMKGRSFNIGLKVNLSNGNKKIGTWRHYYRSDDTDDPLQLKVEEQFNLNGNWHGKIVDYEKNGDIKKIQFYNNGKKVKK